MSKICDEIKREVAEGLDAAASSKRPFTVEEVIERLCLEAEREQAEGNNRVAALLWDIAADFET